MSPQEFIASRLEKEHFDPYNPKDLKSEKVSGDYIVNLVADALEYGVELGKNRAKSDLINIIRVRADDERNNTFDPKPELVEYLDGLKWEMFNRKIK